jgi:glycosyltransferase involved in cell wall biosynthesis
MILPKPLRTINWFGVHPTPYHDFFFQRIFLSRICNLVVFYQEKVLLSHPWNTPLGQSYPIKYYSTWQGIDWKCIILPFAEKESIFIIAGWNHPTNIILISLLKIFRRSYVLWTDTPNLNRARPIIQGWLRGIWLRWIFSDACRLWGTGIPGVDALRQMGAPEKSLEVFPFWLDLDTFDRSRCLEISRNDEIIQFVSSGRLVNSVKGHDLALRALAKAMQGKKQKWKYVIAGSGPDEITLRKLSDELGISDFVFLAGWVEPDELRDLYFRSHVLIHPSPVHDPFPNAVLEGMAASLVVMGSDVCGSVLDRIKSGENGFVHSAGNWLQLAEQIEFLFNKPSILSDLGQKARETAELWPFDRGLDCVRNLLFEL